VKLRRFFVPFVLTVAVGGTALAGSVALLVPAGAEFAQTASFGPLVPDMRETARRSYLVDSTGQLITTLFAEEDREPVRLEDVPRHLVDAVLAIEDRRFYEHDGIDWNGVGRALTENLSAGEVEQGGSTITQQLVKNTMTDSPERDLKAKVREAIIAYRLEKEMSKDEILERYLNVVYFGNGAYGVKAAGERYFNKRDPKDLTVGEAALLAGLIQAPGALDPIIHPDRAARRRALVLEAMVETGALTEEEAAVARMEPLPTSAKSPDRRRDFLVDEVIQRLLKDDPDVPGEPSEFLGPDEPTRYDKVFRGGLRIETTYDPRLQWMAAAAVNQVIPGDSPFTAGVVVLDNATGAVRAMVAGRDFEQLQYNVVTDGRRQTGSSFKAITLATALEAGYSPRDTVSGATFYWRNPRSPESWNPLTCSGGTMSLRDAIVRSNNCAFARTVLSLGPANDGADGASRVIDMAKRLGIDESRLEPKPSITLGTMDTSPLDMAEAFSVFARDGVHLYPVFVQRITGPDGEVLFEHRPIGERVLSEQVARTETDMLTGVIERGTASGNGRIGRPAAGKTGTTDDNKNAWFVGYTPQYTTAVWMGDPVTNLPMSNVGGVRVQGGNLPTRIWALTMRPAHDGLPVVEFTPPDEAQWPRAQTISEDGRSYRRRTISPTTTAPTETSTSAPSTSTPPSTAAPTEPAAPPDAAAGPAPEPPAEAGP
jgi:penicillin-binding protein 1A